MYKQKYKEGQQIHKDIYLYICRYIKEHRYAPSYKEIADGVGVSNVTVLRHMDMLRTDGLIETDHPKTPRAFRLTGYEFVTRRKKHDCILIRIHPWNHIRSGRPCMCSDHVR